MWELTLVGYNDSFDNFIKLQKVLEEVTDYNVMVAISHKDKVIISIALSEYKYIESVKKIILNFIVKECKYHYFKDKIKFLINDKKLNNIFIESLVNVNIIDDVDYARLIVSLNNIIYIESLMYFKLYKLMYFWNEFVFVVNYELINDSSCDIYTKYLKMLTKINKVMTESIYIKKNLKYFYLLNNNGKILKKIEENNEIEIIITLIVCSPKKILIDANCVFDKKISFLINNIFGDRLNFLL